MNASIHHFKRHKARGHTHLHSEHLNRWIWVDFLDRDATPPKPAIWEKLVAMVQHMWYHITLPAELRWNILVFLPKLNPDNRVIGLLEVL